MNCESDLKCGELLKQKIFLTPIAKVFFQHRIFDHLVKQYELFVYSAVVLEIRGDWSSGRSLQ